MEETAQVCDRLRGDEICPFHPDHKVSSLCRTCGILVCFDCMTSSEHGGHTFKKIKECLREPIDSIGKYLFDIDKKLISMIDKELSTTKKERAEKIQRHKTNVQDIKNQRTHLKELIDESTDSKVVQMDEHLQSVLESLDKHIEILESIKGQLNEDKKQFHDVMEQGSEVLKYDTGLGIENKTKSFKVPEQPKTTNLQHIKCEECDQLIHKALGTLLIKECQDQASLLSRSNTAPAQERGPPIPKRNKSKLSTSLSETREPTTSHVSFDNIDPCFDGLAPITKDQAWAGKTEYDKENQKHYNVNKLYLINSSGTVVKIIKTDKNFRSLSAHPLSGKLFGGFHEDKTIRSIDITGKTKIIVECECKPDRITVTNDNHLLVSTCAFGVKSRIYKYKLPAGKLVQKSPDEYEVVQDIDHCPGKNSVVLSCYAEGAVVLDNNMNKMHTFTGLPNQEKPKFRCYTAIFDSQCNLVIGDWENKEVYILDGDCYDLIRKLRISEMACPYMMRLYQNSLWVECCHPSKIMCIDLSPMSNT